MHEHRTKADSGAFGTNGLEGEYSPFREPDANESDRSGRFSGTCETTLNDWIQLVQMGRRDAVVTVRTFDGREGTLWCRDGDIVDADCDGVVGEPAVFRALAWQSGSVSVAFVPVTRYRLIQTATAGLLLEEAYRRDSGIHDLSEMGVPARADFDPGSDTTEISGPSDLIIQGQLATRSEWAAHGDDPDSYVPPDLRPSFSWPFAVAGGVSAILLFSLTAWKWVWPLPVTAATAPQPAPIAARHPVPPVDVPARSRRDVAAAAVPVPALASAPSVSVRKAAPPSRPATYSSVLARRHTAPAPARRAVAIATSALSAPLASPASEGPKAAPPSRIEIIRDTPPAASEPHIQIINEAAGHRQPRIEIIQDRKPRVEMVE